MFWESPISSRLCSRRLRKACRLFFKKKKKTTTTSWPLFGFRQSSVSLSLHWEPSGAANF